MITKEMMLTPLNMGFNAGLNTQGGFITFDETKYANATDRSVLLYSPTKSKFKLKTGTLQPYLEPVFFGIKNNDYFEIEFEAIGNDVLVDFQLGDISPTNVNTLRTSFRHYVKVSSTYYKKYYVTVSMANISNNSLGVFFNIRNLTLNSEVLIRNVKIKIHTDNPYFNLNHRYLKFGSNVDFLKSINKYSKMSLIDYSYIGTAYGNGEITIANNTLSIDSPSGSFKGLVSKLPTPKYRTPIIVSLKYTITAIYGKINVIGFRNGVKENLGTVGLLPTVSETRGIFVVNIADVSNIEDLVLEIGFTGSGTMTVKDCLINICDSSDNIVNHLDSLNALI